MLLKFSDFDLSNGVNSTDFVPTDRKPKPDSALFEKFYPRNIDNARDKISLTP
jgi:hypothetical protein